METVFFVLFYALFFPVITRCLHNPQCISEMWVQHACRSRLQAADVHSPLTSRLISFLVIQARLHTRQLFTRRIRHYNTFSFSLRIPTSLVLVTTFKVHPWFDYSETTCSGSVTDHSSVLRRYLLHPRGADTKLESQNRLQHSGDFTLIFFRNICN